MIFCCEIKILAYFAGNLWCIRETTHASCHFNCKQYVTTKHFEKKTWLQRRFADSDKINICWKDILPAYFSICFTTIFFFKIYFYMVRISWTCVSYMLPFALFSAFLMQVNICMLKIPSGTLESVALEFQWISSFFYNYVVPLPSPMVVWTTLATLLAAGVGTWTRPCWAAWPPLILQILSVALASNFHPLASATLRNLTWGPGKTKRILM